MSLSTRLHVLWAPPLLLVWFAACDSTVEQPGKPPRGTACVAACELQHPAGLYHYELVISECVCTSCSEDCRSEVCGNKQTPSDGCLPCVQDSLEGEACNEHGGLFQTCLGDKECAEFVACVTACDPVPIE